MIGIIAITKAANAIFNSILYSPKKKYCVSGFQTAYNIFVYVGFIRTIPVEMEEAAYIDGAGKFYTFWKIVFPLMKPIISSTLVLNALTVWNDFTT